MLHRNLLPSRHPRTVSMFTFVVMPSTKSSAVQRAVEEISVVLAGSGQPRPSLYRLSAGEVVHFDTSVVHGFIITVDSGPRMDSDPVQRYFD
jgi:hypothetical protein